METALELRDDIRRNDVARYIASEPNRQERPEIEPVIPERYSSTRA